MGTRLLTSFVGSVIAITILLLHKTFVFPVAIAAVTIILLFELFRATDCLRFRLSTGVAFLYGAFLPFFTTGRLLEYRGILTAVAVLLVFATYVLEHTRLKVEQVFLLLGGMLLIPASMSCCVTLNAIGTFGITYVVLALCGAWLADSGAYFVGTFLGKHKLCPTISPKKTIEGFLGGIVTNGLLFVAFNFVYHKIMQGQDVSFEVHYVTTFLLGMLCAVIGTLGDLSASLVKRQYGIKDYGNIMPGHGGLLDRFDSVLFVVPSFCLFISVAELYHV